MGPPDLDRLRTLVHLMDDAVRLPVLGVRVGFDGILGLVPGVGDVTGALVSGWIVVQAVRLGTPPSTVARMLLNLTLDAIGGTVPVVGDLLDIGFKANRRNLELLEAHLADPDRARRRSRLVVAAGVGAVGGVVAGVVVAVWWVLSTLAGVVV